MVDSYLQPTALQLEQQAKFEVEAFEQGVSRFREALLTRDLSELTAGQRLLREIVPGLSEAITKARAEAVERIGDRTGQPPQWAWPIQLLDDPAKIAVITLGCILAMRKLTHDEDRYRPTLQSTAVTPLAREISKAIQLQVEYDKWAGDNPDLEKRLKARYPTVHRNVWRRWRVKVEALRAEPWEAGAEVTLGAHLIHLLVETAPTRFVIEKITLRGKPTTHLTISEATIELISDVTTRGEIARPFLMPMVCPPIPWRYE
jgi:hypothetical protein